MLLATRVDGQFNEAGALKDLIDKFGIEAAPAVTQPTTAPTEAAASSPSGTKKKVGKKRPAAGADGDAAESKGSSSSSSSAESKRDKKEDDEGGDAEAKKARKALTYACEENRPVGDAILEMAKIYFKAGDARKGGVFSKAAKAIREAEGVVDSNKAAMALPGVGKGIAGYIMEYHESGGTIMKLEEMRAGQ